MYMLLAHADRLRHPGSLWLTIPGKHMRLDSKLTQRRERVRRLRTHFILEHDRGNDSLLDGNEEASTARIRAFLI